MAKFFLRISAKFLSKILPQKGCHIYLQFKLQIDQNLSAVAFDMDLFPNLYFLWEISKGTGHLFVYLFLLKRTKLCTYLGHLYMDLRQK